MGDKEHNVTWKEVIDYYIKNLIFCQEEIKVIFAYHTDHPITTDGDHSYRWVKTIEYSTELGNDPNQMALEYQLGNITQEEYMNYNRQIGYSLYGFWEIFYYNDVFDENKYDDDMNELKIEMRNEIIDKIIK